MKTFLLPGMDGGAALLERFRARLPDAIALPYPSDERLSYAQLEARVRARLDASDGPIALVAESFSGPIGIAIAASPPPNLKCVVLVATFDHSPAPPLIASMVPDAAFRRPPPAAFIRWKMLGEDAPGEDVREVQDAIRRVDARVLAGRLRSVLRVDVRAQAAQSRLPVLSLHATKDRLVPHALKLAGSNWTQAQVDGPHLLLHQRADECARLIQRFIVAHN